MHNYSTIPVRLATALLLKHGEISLGEIRALPLVEDEQTVLAIADLLAYNFHVTRFARWDRGAPPTRFEDVIRLVGPVERTAENRLRSSRDMPTCFRAFGGGDASKPNRFGAASSRGFKGSARGLPAGGRRPRSIS